MTQLEEIYLMNVMIYVTSYREIYHLLQVNKKCKRTIKSLKKTPNFKGSESLISFLKRFHPITIDFGCFIMKPECIQDDCEYIKNPHFIITQSNVPKAIELFHKIHTLTLQYHIPDNDNPTIQFEQFAIQHAMEFTSLYRLNGDLQLIVDFLKMYTKNGEELYVPMPKIITIFMNNGNQLFVTESVVEKIERLLTYIRVPENTTIITTFTEHPIDTPENNALLQRLHRITYCYSGFRNDGCEMMSHQYESHGGMFIISNGFGNDRCNGVIEQCHASSVVCGIPSTRFIETKKTTSWKIPDCVETLILQRITMGVEISQHNFGLGFDSNLVTKLIIRGCRLMNIRDSLPNVKYLEIFNSTNITIVEKAIDDQTLSVLPQVTTVIISNSRDCIIHLKHHHLHTFRLFFTSRSELFCETDQLQSIIMRKCNDISLSQMTFDNKEVFIEECETVSFGLFSSTNPLSSLGITNKQFSTLLSGQICLPDIPLTTTQQSSVFRMRKMICVDDHVMMNKNALIKVKEFDGETIIPLFSRLFYSPLNTIESIELHTGNGETKRLPSTIRYFEIHVYGYAIVSIGLVDATVYSFPEGHLGWHKGSIGYHSDDGCIFYQQGYSDIKGLPYGINECEDHIVGCGYNSHTKEVFFTRDGCKVPHVFTVNFTEVFAGIAIADFSKIEINYGDTPFLFNLEEEYIKHNLL